MPKDFTPADEKNILRLSQEFENDIATILKTQSLLNENINIFNNKIKSLYPSYNKDADFPSSLENLQKTLKQLKEAKLKTHPVYNQFQALNEEVATLTGNNAPETQIQQTFSLLSKLQAQVDQLVEPINTAHQIIHADFDSLNGLLNTIEELKQRAKAKLTNILNNRGLTDYDAAIAENNTLIDNSILTIKSIIEDKLNAFGLLTAWEETYHELSKFSERNAQINLETFCEPTLLKEHIEQIIEGRAEFEDAPVTLFIKFLLKNIEQAIGPSREKLSENQINYIHAKILTILQKINTEVENNRLNPSDAYYSYSTYKIFFPLFKDIVDLTYRFRYTDQRRKDLDDNYQVMNQIITQEDEQCNHSADIINSNAKQKKQILSIGLSNPELIISEAETLKLEEESTLASLVRIATHIDLITAFQKLCSPEKSEDRHNRFAKKCLLDAVFHRYKNSPRALIVLLNALTQDQLNYLIFLYQDYKSSNREQALIEDNNLKILRLLLLRKDFNFESKNFTSRMVSYYQGHQSNEPIPENEIKQVVEIILNIFDPSTQRHPELLNYSQQLIKDFLKNLNLVANLSDEDFNNLLEKLGDEKIGVLGELKTTVILKPSEDASRAGLKLTHYIFEQLKNPDAESIFSTFITNDFAYYIFNNHLADESNLPSLKKYLHQWCNDQDLYVMALNNFDRESLLEIFTTAEEPNFPIAKNLLTSLNAINAANQQTILGKLITGSDDALIIANHLQTIIVNDSVLVSLLKCLNPNQLDIILSHVTENRALFYNDFSNNPARYRGTELISRYIELLPQEINDQNATALLLPLFEIASSAADIKEIIFAALKKNPQWLPYLSNQIINSTKLSKEVKNNFATELALNPEQLVEICRTPRENAQNVVKFLCDTHTPGGFYSNATVALSKANDFYTNRFEQTSLAARKVLVDAFEPHIANVNTLPENTTETDGKRLNKTLKVINSFKESWIRDDNRGIEKHWFLRGIYKAIYSFVSVFTKTPRKDLQESWDKIAADLKLRSSIIKFPASGTAPAAESIIHAEEDRPRVSPTPGKLPAVANDGSSANDGSLKIPDPDLKTLPRRTFL